MKTIKEMEETFKPSDLVEYFVKEYPEQTWLEDALKNTTVSHWISSAYCYCNNKEGLKFRGNYHVNHPNYYIVVLVESGAGEAVQRRGRRHRAARYCYCFCYCY